MTGVDPLIIWLLVGLVGGLIASLLFGGNNIWRYLAAGVAGAAIVGYLVSFFGIPIPIDSWLLRHLAVATGGAVFVIILARVFD